MKIFIADKIAQSCLDELVKCGHTIFEGNDLKRDEIIKHIADYDVLIVRSKTKVNKELIDSAKKLKLVIRGGVTIENIDHDYAEQHSIQVMNTPEASSVSVAELTMGLMINLSRNICLANISMKKGNWETRKFQGNELYGKTLGIIGFGRIGREVGKRALAFNMNVCAYDKYLEQSVVKDIPFIPLNDLLQKSDIISLHVPLIKDNQYLIGEKEFSQMKKGVMIINCARGGVMDEIALIQNIENGMVAGAALDVYEKEPPINMKIYNNSRIICTPHIGALTQEAQERIGEQIIKIIKGFESK